MKTMSDSLIDISVPLGPSLPIWPGSTGLTIERVSSFEKGNDVNVTGLSCDVHTGTHIEAPLHFIPGGSGVTEIPLDVLIGDVLVACTADADVITSQVLDSLPIPRRTKRLLLRTKNSGLWDDANGTFVREYATLNKEAARWIVDRGIKLLGVDYLSVETYGDAGCPIHKTLLAGGVIIVESLNLSGISPGMYELICLPLKLTGAEAAPARAVLRVMKGEHNG